MEFKAFSLLPITKFSNCKGSDTTFQSFLGKPIHHLVKFSVDMRERFSRRNSVQGDGFGTTRIGGLLSPLCISGSSQSVATFEFTQTSECEIYIS
jgi:hypothetical protein